MAVIMLRAYASKGICLPSRYLVMGLYVTVILWIDLAILHASHSLCFRKEKSQVALGKKHKTWVVYGET